MQFHLILIVYFFYGLAFFSMGLLVAIEGGRSSDPRLRRALRPLAAFGLIHGVHEWVEVYSQMELLLGNTQTSVPEALRLAILSFSFLSLAAFGTYLLAGSVTAQRLSMLVPLGLEAIWVFGLATLRGRYPIADVWAVADVWTRYTLAIPAGLLAAVGLVAQQRAFRRAGLVRFGQDALWAAVAFGWYGLIGQIFTNPSPLPPSNVVNSDLFLQWFGFPVQLMRALAAVVAAVFVVRFLRAFQVEIERQIAGLQEARLQEAEERERLRKELFKRVVAAQESERQRIARELHDETGQALTAIGMGLRGLASAVGGRGRKADPQRAAATLHQLESLAAGSLTELQRLIADLRPSHLDDLGLASALRWYASDIEERTRLQVQVEIAGEEREVSPVVKTALFRIAQEALTNVIKHAGARHVLIVLEYEAEEVRLRVDDDGKGFDLQATGSGKRMPWGLKGMEERATLLGGRFTVRSQPGRGTTVEGTIPYLQENAEV